MDVLVATCAHRGDDARIVQRQVDALLQAGHRVTFVAPAPVQTDREGLRHVEIPRVRGRHRVHAWYELIRAIRRERGGADLLLVHDLELVPLCWLLRRPTVKVWDVHEDLAASVQDRVWLPRWLRGSVAWVVRAVERVAPYRFHLLAAEHAYTSRLGDVPVVPNSTMVPADCPPPVPGDHRVVYIGRVSVHRGWPMMRDLALELAGTAEVHVIGEADSDVRDDVQGAHDAGTVVWAGYVPNRDALARVDGALVGLCLLSPIPNYLHSMPTKIVEYLGHGVPVVTTDLPLAREIVEASGGGAVVAHGDVGAAAAAIRELLADPEHRRGQGAAGHEYVAAHHNWAVDGPRFVAVLVDLVDRPRATRPAPRVPRRYDRQP